MNQPFKIDTSYRFHAPPITTVELDPSQDKLWEETRTALLYRVPYWSHLLYTMLHHRGGKLVAIFTPEVPIAATDGRNMLLNPTTFFDTKTYSLANRVFACAHEVAHAMFGHCELLYLWRKRGFIAYPDGVKLQFNEELAQHSMDYFINAMLVESNTGTIHKNWLYDKAYVDSTVWGVVDIYRDRFKPSGKPDPDTGVTPGGIGSKPQPDQGVFDTLLKPGEADGKEPGQAAGERDDQAWKTAVAGAIAAAKAQGKLPENIKRMFEELVEPKVDWTDRIEALFARKIGTADTTWRSPDRRWIARPGDPIYFPSRTGYGAGTIVVGVDDSGSIGDEELTTFFSEMVGLLEQLQPQKIVVIWCASTVQRIDYVEDMDDLMALYRGGAPGTGGTDFRPVFDAIDDLDVPDIAALVYLTDGWGTFPDGPPNYPVIWGSIDAKEGHYPFGEYVELPFGPNARR